MESQIGLVQGQELHGERITATIFFFPLNTNRTLHMGIQPWQKFSAQEAIRHFMQASGTLDQKDHTLKITDLISMWEDGKSEALLADIMHHGKIPGWIMILKVKI